MQVGFVKVIDFLPEYTEFHILSLNALHMINTYLYD